MHYNYGLVKNVSAVDLCTATLSSTGLVDSTTGLKLLFLPTESVPNEPRHMKTGFFAYAKTKTQISFAVTAKLISAFVFAT